MHRPHDRTLLLLALSVPPRRSLDARGHDVAVAQGGPYTLVTTAPDGPEAVLEVLANPGTRRATNPWPLSP